MLLAVRAFFPNAQRTLKTKLVVIPSYTDNRENGALLNKLMSSKYPLSALLMEFGEQLRRSGHHEKQTAKQIGWRTVIHRASTLRFVCGYCHRLEDGSYSTKHWSGVRRRRTRRGSSWQKRGQGRSEARGRGLRTGFA